MKCAKRFVCVTSMLLAAGMFARRANAQADIPPAPPATLWTFLGFPPPPPPDVKAANTAMCLGVPASDYPMIKRTPMSKLFHGLLVKPLLMATGMMPGALPLEAPANLASDNAAIAAAAAIKQQEALVPQKIAALRYFGQIGCECGGDREQAITDGLLAGLADCNERVRLAAIRAIKRSKCCAPPIQEKLASMASETDDYGEFLEPSERVRQAATEALCDCPPPPAPEEAPAPVPLPEGPSPEAPVDGAVEPPATEASLPLSPSAGLAVAGGVGVTAFASVSASDVRPAMATQVQVRRERIAQIAAGSRRGHAALTEPSPVRGQVASVDQRSGVVFLHFPGQAAPLVGSRVTISHRYLFGARDLGELSIIEQNGEAAVAVPVGDLSFGKVSKGDLVAVSR
jgi:hypothetical protein